MLDNLDLWFAHITTPRVELGNKPICPFAKPAIQAKQYTVESTDIHNIEEQIGKADTVTYKVCIFTLKNYIDYSILELEEKTQLLNSQYSKQDKVVLDSDPRNPFTISGVTTTFPDCYLWIVQSLSDLTEKSNLLRASNYYSYWTQKQIDEIVAWRNPIQT